MKAIVRLLRPSDSTTYYFDIPFAVLLHDLFPSNAMGVLILQVREWSISLTPSAILACKDRSNSRRREPSAALCTWYDVSLVIGPGFV